MTSLAQLIVAASFSVSAAYGLPDPELCAAPAGSTWGTVESVREVPLLRDIHAFDPEALEHKVAPETTEELVVQLDAGPVVIFTGRPSQGVHAGQRVVVTLGGSDAHVEPEFCPVPTVSSPWVSPADLLRHEDVRNDQDGRGRSFVLDPVRHTLTGSMESVTRARLQKSR